MFLTFKLCILVSLSFLSIVHSFAQNFQNGNGSKKKVLSDYVYFFEAQSGFFGGGRQLRDVKDNRPWPTSPAMEPTNGPLVRASVGSKFGTIKYTNASYSNPAVPSSSPYARQQGLFRLKYESPELLLNNLKVRGIDLKVVSKIDMDQIIWNEKFLGTYDKEIDPKNLPNGTVIFEKFRTVEPTILLAAPKIPIIKEFRDYSVDASAVLGVMPLGMVNFRRKNDQLEMIVVSDNVISGFSMALAIAIKKGDKTYLRFFFDEKDQLTPWNSDKAMTNKETTFGCDLGYQFSDKLALALSMSVHEILQKIDIPDVKQASIVKTNLISIEAKYKLGH